MVRLDNGLRVVAVPADAPAASVWLWLDAGAADEAPGHAGVAHLLEHMLFKGTARRGIGEASAEIERAGGDLNAFTSWDHTVLHAQVRGTRWETAIDVLADLARNPLFDAAELAREQHVVLDEIRSYDEEVGVAVHDRLRELLFGAHPYGRPVLGWHRTVAPLDRAAVHGFWERNWRPERATLVVVGPVVPDAVLTAARDALGGWAPGAGRPPIPPLPVPARSVAVQVERPFDAAEVQIGWPAPDLHHPDLPALTLAAAVLGQGSASALAVDLQLDQGLVGDAWASFGPGLAGGSFTVGFVPAEGETADAIAGAMEVVDRLRRGALPGSRIGRARDGLLAQSWFDHETVDGVASDVAWFTAQYGDPAAGDRQRRQLAAVQPDEVVAAAHRWLAPERAVLACADPALKPRKLASAWKRAVRVVVPPIGRAGPRLETLPNGVRVAILPDEGRVAAVRVAMLGGGMVVGARQAGIQAAWSDLVQAGCGPWDAVDYRKRIDDLAAAVHTSATPSTLSLSASFPASEIEEGFELVAEAIRDPHFDPEEWERIQDELLDELRTLSDRPADVAERELDRLLWGEHPWALPWGGTPSSVKAMSPRAIRRWHKLHADPRRMVVGVAGGVDPEWTLDVIADWLGELEAGPPLPARPAASPPRRGRHVRHAGQQQATVVAALRTGNYRHADRHALGLAATVLDGPSGRLFLDLRERRALGYDTWADHRIGVDGGTLTLGATCAPDRVDEAAEALVAALVDLARGGPTDDELARVRELLDGDLQAGLQRASARAANLAFAILFDRPWQPDVLAAERASVTPDAVRAALTALDPADPVVLVVRPKQ